MTWYGARDPRAYHGGLEAIESYRRALQQRRQQYAWRPTGTWKAVVDDLERQGFTVLRQAFDRDRLLRLRAALEDALRRPELLKKDDVNMRMVSQPLVTLPAAVKVVFDDLLIEVAAQYLRCLPGVGTLNIRQSLVSDGPPVETMLFHCDKNSIRFLKFFFYLNRVERGGGPFTYVAGSHAHKFDGWLSKHRWSHDEIARLYGEERIRYLTADVGDVIVANTTGFHRGTKPETAERFMFTVDYGIHVERGGKDSRFWMWEEDYAALPAWKKPVADFLRRMPRTGTATDASGDGPTVAADLSSAST